MGAMSRANPSHPRMNLVKASLGACLVVCVLLTFPDMVSLIPAVNDGDGSNNHPEEGTFVAAPIISNPQHATRNITTVSSHLQRRQPQRVNDIFWCEASRLGSMPEGKNFHHFPHAMIYVGMCWSWFLKQNAYPGRCGFLLDTFTYKRMLEKANSDWVVSIFEATNCYVRVVDPPNANLSALHDNYYTPDLSPQNKLYKHTWVEKPEHAWKLRDLLLQQQNRTLPTRITKNPDNSYVVRIGFLDRFDTRSITNMDDLILHVSQRYDRVVLDKTWFTGTTPIVEQLAWFASHDIIIGAHGAAMTNCMFLQPGTVVIEIFPINYYPVDFFGSLITQVASRHVPLYADGTPLLPKDPAAKRLNLQEGIAAFKVSSHRVEERHTFRSVNITVRIDDVTYLLDRELKRITGKGPLVEMVKKHAYKLRME
eukprot:CAMPEP_0119025186 /NCGR_PEP_ID=MMETSP1176-20130426/33303_1 /TAXON_ID=265551 /ORGANISM="Synedropsis recta cf, Strain CCMP1620" /LENGTH=423 /DNA_ID=CAMNT_0006980675 /DNA_START=114 /DNA_END=1382 /DNA_ORIENTATION=-